MLIVLGESSFYIDNHEFLKYIANKIYKEVSLHNDGWIVVKFKTNVAYKKIFLRYVF
jgi:hypothetical protein